MDKDSIKQIIEANPEKVAVMNRHRDLWMDEMWTFYRNLCHVCRQKVARNTMMSLEEYCPLCKERAKHRLEKIKEAYKQ